MPQPDNEPYFQHFHHWISTNLLQGVAASSAPHDRFVPKSSLEAYFVEDQCTRLNQILSRLFPEANHPAVSPRDILHSDGYLRAFATLLSIGEGDYIETFVRHDTLADSKMPFTSKPARWPASPSRPDFFEQFAKNQWMFCPADMSLGGTKEWQKERILPILSRTELRPGGASKTYKVEIHKDYCDAS